MYPQGHSISRLVATGGGARSRLWRQIISDITGICQDHVPATEGPLGAAYVAGLATGIFQDFSHLSKSWVEVASNIQPVANAHEKYQPHYEAFVALHVDLKETFKKHQKIVLGEI
jgi:xylulokinase